MQKDTKPSVARAVVVVGLALMFVLTGVQIVRASGIQGWLEGLTHGAGDALGGAVALLLLALLIPFCARGRRWALWLSALLQLGLVAGIVPYLLVGFAHPEDFAAWLLNVTYLVVGLLAAGFSVVAALEAGGRLRPAGWWSGETATVFAAAALWLGMVAVGGAVAVAPRTGGGLDAPAQAVVTVTLNDMYFSPRRLELSAGRPTAVVLVNRSTESHSFDVDSLDVHVRVPSRSTVTTLLQPPTSGTLPFYCGIPGHAAAGMTGTLVVN